MAKLFFLDLETTGVMHWRNGIHSIAGCIEIDGGVKRSFDYKVQPNPACTIDDEALKVSNVSRETIAGYPHMSLVYQSITAMLGRYVNKYSKTDKFFLVGYNANFDNSFFRAFFLQNGDKYYGSFFWSSVIDVMVLAAEYLKDVRQQMKDFKLMTVARQLGIEIDETKLHDSAYDIEITRQVYKRVTVPQLIKTTAL